MGASGKTVSKLESYRAEIRRSRIRTAISLSIVVAFSSFVIMLASGDRFNNILRYFGIKGISNEERGVYTDCSRPENKDVSYCQPKRTDPERQWNDIEKNGGSYNPFTLYKLDEKTK